MPNRFANGGGYILIWWREENLIICVLAVTF